MSTRAQANQTVRASPRAELVRAFGPAGASLIVLNSMIGAGIYALPSALQSLDAWGPWLFVLMGLAMSTIVIAFAHLARYFEATGGPVLYTAEAFGPFASFQTGWLLYLGRLTAMAANTALLVDYAGALLPGLVQPPARIIAIFTVCALLAWSNLSGVKRGMATLMVLTVGKILPLGLLVIAGLRFASPSAVIPHAAFPATEAGDAALLLVYALIGFEGALVTAGETKDPTRSIPRALVPTVLGVAAFYGLIQVVYLGLGNAVDSTSSTPLVDAAGIIFGGPGFVLMTVAAVLSIAGNLSAIMVAAPRMTFALAREGLLPRFFGSVSPRTRVPTWSIGFLAVVSFVLAASGSFGMLAAMSSLARMVAYFASIAALPFVRRSRGELPFRRRDGYVILALMICVWVAAQSTGAGWIALGAFMTVGAVLYVISRQRES